MIGRIGDLCADRSRIGGEASRAVDVVATKASAAIAKAAIVASESSIVAKTSIVTKVTVAAPTANVAPEAFSIASKTTGTTTDPVVVIAERASTGHGLPEKANRGLSLLLIVISKTATATVYLTSKETA